MPCCCGKKLPKVKLDEPFPKNNKMCQMPFCVAIFVICMCAMIGIGIWGWAETKDTIADWQVILEESSSMEEFSDYREAYLKNSSNWYSDSWDAYAYEVTMMYIWLGILLVVLVFLWIIFFFAIPNYVVQTTIIIGIVISLGSSAMNFMKLYTIPSGVAMILRVIGKIIWYIASKNKITVGKTLVEVSLRSIRAHPSALVVVFFGFLLQMLCGLGLLGSVVRWGAADVRTYVSIILAYWVFDAFSISLTPL